MLSLLECNNWSSAVKYTACVVQLSVFSGLYQVPLYVPGVHAQWTVIMTNLSQEIKCILCHSFQSIKCNVGTLDFVQPKKHTELQQVNSANLPKPSGTHNLKFKEVIPNCSYNHPGRKNVFSQKINAKTFSCRHRNYIHIKRAPGLNAEGKFRGQQPRRTWNSMEKIKFYMGARVEFKIKIYVAKTQ